MAMMAFEKAWNAAETKGGCVTTVSVTDAETEVGGVVDAAVAELTGTPEDALLTTPAAQACAARKLAATGKDAKAQFACDTTGVKHAMLFSPACVNKAGGALVKAWDAAEAKGGCATQGDSEGLNISGLSGWGVRNLDPATPMPCGTFLLAFGWGVADGKPTFETCTSGCQAGIQGSGNGQFNGPAGVAVDGSGHVFVDDDSQQPHPEVRQQRQIPHHVGHARKRGRAVQRAVDRRGRRERERLRRRHVNNYRIQKFDNGRHVPHHVGHPGSGNGQFNEPTASPSTGAGTSSSPTLDQPPHPEVRQQRHIPHDVGQRGERDRAVQRRRRAWPSTGAGTSSSPTLGNNRIQKFRQHRRIPHARGGARGGGAGSSTSP